MNETGKERGGLCRGQWRDTIIRDKWLDCRVVRGIGFKDGKVVFANNESYRFRDMAIGKGHVCRELIPREHPGH